MTTWRRSQSWGPSLAAALLARLLLLGGVACAPSPPPAPPYRLGDNASSECPRSVQLFTPEQVARPYRELSEISATCPYVSPTTCDRILLARGCDLGADAVVILKTSTLGTSAAGATSARRSLGGPSARLVEEARLVRWSSNDPTR